MSSSQDKKSSYKKQKMTLLLDSETIELIRNYGIIKLGSNSISASVRAMAREYGKDTKNTE